MANSTVTYISPAWGLIPTQEQMARTFHAVHVQVKFEEDSGNAAVLHNLNLPYGAPLQEPQWLILRSRLPKAGARRRRSTP
jgi:hypothetical protein